MAAWVDTGDFAGARQPNLQWNAFKYLPWGWDIICAWTAFPGNVSYHYTKRKIHVPHEIRRDGIFVFATKARCHIVWCNETRFSGVAESSGHFKYSARSREGNAKVTACKTTKVFTSAHFCSTLRQVSCSICFLFLATALFVMFARDLLIVISGLFWATDQIV